MNQCWISGPIVENAKVHSETAIRFPVRANILRFDQEIEVIVSCHMEMVVEALADYLVSEGEGTEVEFCGEVLFDEKETVILVDPACFRIVRIPVASDSD